MQKLFLGTDPNSGERIPLPMNRHALTIAGSRMGKGACQIIPTLMEWSGSAIVIDPKGETARETIEARHKLGQEVAVIAPIQELDAKVEPYRRSFNPLSLVRSGGAGFRDLLMIADGLVMRTGKEDDPHWNESALSVIAGLLAFMLEDPEEPAPNLGLLPTQLTLLRRLDARAELLPEMSKCKEFGGLAADVAALFSVENDETASILSNSARHVRFLRDADMLKALDPSKSQKSAVDLRGLRDGTLTLYIVIDPGSLALNARFMRLFVRMALSIMMQTQFSEGQSTNAPCLFVLDEFYSLGQIEEVQKAAGLMPGYNVHLWPILQDWGQLVDLYGEHGAQTFLANADALSIFGVSDQATLGLASSLIGPMSTDELEDEALDLARRIENSEAWRQVLNAGAAAGNQLVENRQLQTLAGLLQTRIGQPKLLPADIQNHIGRSFSDEEDVAKRMYVFLRHGEILDLIPTPYFSSKKKSWFGRT